MNFQNNDYEIFNTYETSGNAMNLLPKCNDDASEQLEKAFEDSFTMSEVHNGNIKASDDDSERKGYGTAQAEDAKFLIPNEGNINKSPLSLLTKATNVFAVGANDQLRNKFKSFQSYKRFYKRRSTTPHNRNQIKSNLRSSEKVHFESVKPREVERSSQRFGMLNSRNVVPRLSRHSKRSHTIKNRVNHLNKNNISRVLESNQRMLPQLRQSIEPSSHHIDQEDFLFNDIDEKVSSNKKYFRGVNADKINYKLQIRNNLDKDNSFKQHIRNKNQLFRDFKAIKNSNGSARNTNLMDNIKHYQNKKINKFDLKDGKYVSPKFTILDKSVKSDPKRLRNMQQLNSFQENIDSISNDNEESPENLKMSSEKREQYKYNDPFYNPNPSKLTFPNLSDEKDQKRSTDEIPESPIFKSPNVGKYNRKTI